MKLRHESLDGNVEVSQRAIWRPQVLCVKLDLIARAVNGAEPVRIVVRITLAALGTQRILPQPEPLAPIFSASAALQRIAQKIIHCGAWLSSRVKNYPLHCSRAIAFTA